MAKSTTLAKSEELQHLFETSSGEITVGIDLGDRYSHCCVLGPDGVVFAEGRVRTTPDAMASHFKSVPSALITIEVGTHSRWVSQLFQDLAPNSARESAVVPRRGREWPKSNTAL